MSDLPTAPSDRPVLDRSGLERVLARAAELQAITGDAPESLSEKQLLDLGNEVGLSAEHLRQALAEERGRALVEPESGLAVQLAGVSTVAAARVVPGTPASVLAALDTLMQRDEVLVPKRRFPERLVWEAQRGFVGGIRRGFALSGKLHHLTNATDVTAAVTAVDPGRVHVRLSADFSETRGRRITGAAAATAVLLMIGAPLLVMGIAPLLAAIPPLALAATTVVVTRSQYQKVLARAQVALEQALDRLEFAPAKPPHPVKALLDAIAPQRSR